MPEVEVRVDCPVYDSFRVQQLAGLFDVPIVERASASFAVDVPGVDEDWRIGLIVGPSGSGKTTIARAAFGPSVYAMPPWPADQAVIDGFGELPIRKIVGLLTAVGFSSPPSWIKPYGVLSGGEQFRCDLARALATAAGRPRRGIGAAAGGVRRIHQRRRPASGPGRLGGGGQGGAWRPGGGAVCGGRLSLRRRRVARARLDRRHGDARSKGGVFGDRTSAWRCSAAVATSGHCLRRITI